LFDSIDAEQVFTMLARLRGLRDDIEVLNQYLARNRTAQDGLEAHRVECVLRNLEAFDMLPPETARGIVAEDLAAFVRVIEDDAYGSSVHPARRVLASDGMLEYRSLFEYYHVNDVVVAPASPLGGAQVAYRVCDVFFNKLRSIFGGQKLSFHLALEWYVALRRSHTALAFY
jgi:hypothetical protein